MLRVETETWRLSGAMGGRPPVGALTGCVGRLSSSPDSSLGRTAPPSGTRLGLLICGLLPRLASAPKQRAQHPRARDGREQEVGLRKDKKAGLRKDKTRARRGSGPMRSQTLGAGEKADPLEGAWVSTAAAFDEAVSCVPNNLVRGKEGNFACKFRETKAVEETAGSDEPPPSARQRPPSFQAWNLRREGLDPSRGPGVFFGRRTLREGGRCLHRAISRRGRMRMLQVKAARTSAGLSRYQGRFRFEPPHPAPGAPSPPTFRAALPGAMPGAESTLDESILATVMRDVRRISTNLRTVLLPVHFGGSGDRDSVVRDWDLWGPMLFSLLLSVSLSSGSKEPGKLFSLVFGVAVLGALVLTVNVSLLGGRIAFFGSLSLLGYCIFPIALAAFACVFLGNIAARAVLLVVALVWSSWAGVPFIAGSVPARRKGLAVYPLFLIYAFLAWLTLLR